MESIWVAVVRVSPAVRKKLSARHGLDADEVANAIQCVVGLAWGWDDHPERGRRAIVRTSVRNAKVLVVLYPTDDPDVWNLGSAYPTGS